MPTRLNRDAYLQSLQKIRSKFFNYNNYSIRLQLPNELNKFLCCFRHQIPGLLIISNN